MTGSHEVRGSIPLSSTPTDTPRLAKHNLTCAAPVILDGGVQSAGQPGCTPPVTLYRSTSRADSSHRFKGRQGGSFLPAGKLTGLIAGEVNIPIFEYPVILTQG